jgi:hypothetical protein
VGDEVTPGGSRVFRHEAREREHEVTSGDPLLIESVDKHIERVLGDARGTVFHELVSDRVHLDVHVVPPGSGRDWKTLVTCGMAERPMTVPEGLEDYRYAELMLALPSSWPLVESAFADEANYWPVRLLKSLARLPHDYDTFLCYGHTVPNGDPPEPYAPGTDFCGALVGGPMLAPEAFEELALTDGRLVRFMAVFPLYADEMDFKLEHGAEALSNLFVANEVTEWIDVGRPSVVTR